MSYYSDLDNDLGADSEVAEMLREKELERRHTAVRLKPRNRSRFTARTIEVQCEWCNDKFTARVADRKRGWARYCSKSCKAMMQTYGRRHRKGAE